MTDTARTAAAIKALLTDNTFGDISAQDMRDFVESVSNPLYAGGFLHSNAWAVGGSYWGHMQDAPTIASGAWESVPLAAYAAQTGGSQNGDGAVAIGDVDIYSPYQFRTLLAGTWLSLTEPGWYFVSSYVYFAHDTVGNRGGYFDYVDYPISNNDGVYGDPQYIYISNTPTTTIVSEMPTYGLGEPFYFSGWLRVLPSAVPFRIVQNLLQTSGNPLGITALSLTIGRVS